MTDNIHANVREYYGARVRDYETQQAASCCGSDTSCGCGADLYNAQLISDLPADVTNLAFGCGDPVTIAGLQTGETVLDLGSGAGIDCFLASKQVGDTGYVIGIDMTPEMLNKANANKARMGVTNVEFRRGQIEALPVVNDSVDVAMSNCVINLSPDKAAVFNEVFRVLKPGGRISISDIVTEGEFTTEQRADAELWSGCVSGAIDAQAYTDLMRAAGFVDVAIIDKNASEPSISPRIYSARITGRKPVDAAGTK